LPGKLCVGFLLLKEIKTNEAKDALVSDIKMMADFFIGIGCNFLDK